MKAFFRARDAPPACTTFYTETDELVLAARHALLASPEAFGSVIDRLVDCYKDKQVDAVLSAEARGFIFAAPLALRLGASFVPVRKPGKLPSPATTAWIAVATFAAVDKSATSPASTAS